MDERLRDLVATLLVEGRECDVTPVRGSVEGAASGVAAHLGIDSEDLDSAWMPGRIAIVHAGDLSSDEVDRLLSPPEKPAFAAVILLADDAVDTTRFQRVETTVPVVISRRLADRPRLALAKRVELAVEPLSAVLAAGRPRHEVWRFQVSPRLPASGPSKAHSGQGTVPAPREARERTSH